jgi:hypothetical protein
MTSGCDVKVMRGVGLSQISQRVSALTKSHQAFWLKHNSLQIVAAITYTLFSFQDIILF